MSALVLLVYVVNGTWNGVWGWRHDAINEQGFCIPNNGHGSTRESFSFVVTGTLIYSLIPASFITIFNILIISHLIIQHRRRAEIVQKQGKSSTFILINFPWDTSSQINMCKFSNGPCRVKRTMTFIPAKKVQLFLHMLSVNLCLGITMDIK